MSKVEINAEGWGIVGVSHSWDTTRRVMTRSVNARVRYQPPPLPARAPVWRNTANEQIFELSLNSDPRAAQSLISLCGKLKERWHELRRAGWTRKQDPEIVRFNVAVEKVLECVRHLHAHHCGLGVTTQQSILFLPTPEGEQLVLPDLGFFWEEGRRHGPFLPRRPDFLSKAESFSFLWGDDGQEGGDVVARQQSRGLVQGEDFDPKQDVRSLARMLATCLLDKPCRQPPPPTEENGTNVDTWHVLDLACAGEFQSLKDFEQALSEAPLIEYYLGRRGGKPPAVQRHNRWKQAAFAGVALALLGSAVTFLKLYPRAMHGNEEFAEMVEQIASDPNPPAPRLLTNDSQFYEPAATFRGSIDAAADKSLPALQAMLRAVSSDDLEQCRAEAGWLVACTRRWIKAWKAELDGAEQVLADPLRYDEAPALLNNLQRQMDALVHDSSRFPSLEAEEKQCLDYCVALLGQQ